MKSVFKYPLAVTDTQTLLLPTGSKVLSVEEQYGSIVLYVLVDPTPEAETEPRRFLIHGTGHDVTNPDADFVGTVKLEGGALMFHVFVDQR